MTEILDWVRLLYFVKVVNLIFIFLFINFSFVFFEI